MSSVPQKRQCIRSSQIDELAQPGEVSGGQALRLENQVLGGKAILDTFPRKFWVSEIHKVHRTLSGGMKPGKEPHTPPPGDRITRSQFLGIWESTVPRTVGFHS